MTRARRPHASEKQEQSAICELVLKIGGRTWTLGHPSPNDGRTHRGTGQSAGIPDLWLWLPPLTEGACGFATWWEVKRPGGKLTPDQAAFRGFCMNAGTEHNFGTLDDFLGEMRGRGYVKPNGEL